MMKLLGTTDEKTTCECCGKKNLKRTVALEMVDGAVVYYGVDCAAKALNKKASAYKVEVSAMDYALSLVGKYDAQIIARAVWNKFGFCTEVKGGTLIIAGVGELAL